MAQLAADKTPAPSAQRQPKPRWLLGIGAIAIAGFVGWRYLVPQPPVQSIHLSGRIEADETEIGAKTGGRLVAVTVQEGQPVTVGQVVAEIEDEEVTAQLQGAKAQVTTAQQEEQQARLEIEVVESRIQEAEVTLQQSQGDATGRMNQATSNVAAARAQLAQAIAQVGQAEAQIKQAQAELKLATTNRDRYAQLVSQGAVNQQQFDQAQTAVETAQAAVETGEATLRSRQAAVQTTQDQLAAAQGNLTQTQTTRLNPDIRSSQIAALQRQKEQATAKLAAAQAKVKTAIAAQQQLQKRLDSFQIKSPISGVVQSRPLEPGAVVSTGKTVLTVIDPTSVYLRGYIPEGDVGRIHVGMVAQVFLDSNPQQPLVANVSAIDTKASFTPENIYFQKDRVRQVFGVKLAIAQTAGYAKPGMPADATIDVK